MHYVIYHFWRDVVGPTHLRKSCGTPQRPASEGWSQTTPHGQTCQFPLGSRLNGTKAPRREIPWPSACRAWTLARLGLTLHCEHSQSIPTIYGEMAVFFPIKLDNTFRISFCPLSRCSSMRWSGSSHVRNACLSKRMKHGIQKARWRQSWNGDRS